MQLRHVLLYVVAALSYAWLLKLCWTQSSRLAVLAEQNNQLRIRLFSATAKLAEDRNVIARGELSEEVIQKTRVVEFLNQVLAANKPAVANTNVPQPAAPVMVVQVDQQAQITTLSKSLDLIKAELVLCQQNGERLQKEIQAKSDCPPASATASLSSQRVVKKITPRPTVDDMLKMFEEEENEPPPQTPPAAPKCVATFEFDKKRAGATYSSTMASSANRCKRLCLSDVDCQAWVFDHEENQCDLMLNAGASMPHKCCVSGLRCGGGGI